MNLNVFVVLLPIQIYTYSETGPMIEHEQFYERVDWNGSKRSNDIQDASIYLLNVTFNDSGTYQCFFNRILTYERYRYKDVIGKVVHLTVVGKGRRTSVLGRCCTRLTFMCLMEHRTEVFQDLRAPNIYVHVNNPCRSSKLPA